MTLPLALQTISWGKQPDIGEMLDRIREARYSGVEVFQHPEQLRGAREFASRLSEHGLEFVGLMGGSLEQKLQFVSEFCRFRDMAVSAREAPYLYIEQWDGPLAEQALKEGFRLAVHPHMYKPIQTLEEAERLLSKYPTLRFLPDTAHLTVAGDEPVDAIDRNFNRIDAIQLKDWKAEVGRSYQFYASGFCELGSGDVCLEKVLDLLVRRRYAGWLVVEQDFAENPYGSAARSRDWLAGSLPSGAIETARSLS